VAPSDVFKPVIFQAGQPKLPDKDSRGHGMSVGLRIAGQSICDSSSLPGPVLTAPCSSHQVIQDAHQLSSEALRQNSSSPGQNVMSPVALVAQSQSGQSSAQALFSHRGGVTAGSQEHSDENGSLSEARTSPYLLIDDEAMNLMFLIEAPVSRSLTRRPRSCVTCRHLKHGVSSPTAGVMAYRTLTEHLSV
jgi:hypothetical protein